MTVTTIILSHYKEREKNLPIIVNDLLSGETKPDEIVVFIDNPEIHFEHEKVTIIRSNKGFLPKIRFVVGTYFNTDYCFFIDDDMSVRSKTLSNFIDYSNNLTEAILGVEGSILGETPTPYTSDTSINRGNKLQEVDVLIRSYFVPRTALLAGLSIQQSHHGLPQKSLDDVYLCLGYKVKNNGRCFVVPVDEESTFTELDEAGVGQSKQENHYSNRNDVCSWFIETFNL